MSFFSPNYVLQMQTPHQDIEEDPQFPTLICPPLFNNLQDLKVLGKRSVSFSGVDICEAAAADELSDDEGMQAAGEKKRRLSMEQVRTLEKNFELGNKLEPERKMQLASVLGLQPRQVAIWFQNRRARWKTKQLEKDYEVLQRQFEAIKSENEALKSHHKKLQSEIMALKGRETSELINLNKETEGSCSNRSENSSEINLECPFPHPQQNFSFYQSSIRASEMEQILQTNSSKPPEKIKCPKIESGVSEGISFNNLLCSMELDQSASFWPWYSSRKKRPRACILFRCPQESSATTAKSFRG